MEQDINLSMQQKIKKNSLAVKIWQYLVLFSVIILAFLWFFQVIFLKSYYKITKKKELKEVATTLLKQKNSGNLIQIIDNITYDKSICIEITDRKTSSIQTSSIISRGCLMDYKNNYTYKEDFILSNQQTTIYELENPRFKNETLIYAIRLDNNMYAFINTSIDPMDSTTQILKNQLIYVTIGVLLLSFIIAYFISKHISKPIVKINESAKKMANGKYNINFNIEENIEEINELAQTLNFTKNELAKTDELRRDLMANVSHDLKTPLTMIKAYAEMARDLNQDKKTKREENLNIIIEETDRLTILVNDILTLSKMQSKIEKLQKEEFDLITLIDTIIKRYTIFKETENYTFKFIHQDKTLLIKADKKKIEQVIYNLINNAINYTGEDNLVTIKINTTKNILIEISDTGKGIKKEEIKYIWDKYYKDQKKHKRNIVGTGLGLSIVKKILEEHHYKYGVKSTINEGSTFFFEIPKEK